MKPTFLEIRHLKTLIALKETGSVSLAAKRIYLTQSALSHQIKLLEDQYGLALFERKSQPLRFTAAGERLIKLANEVLPQIIEAERDLSRVKQGEAGELRIAVECHTCFDWLMPAMDSFRQHWPLVELDIVSGFHTDPVGLLLTHRADWAVVSEVEETVGITYKPLFSYEMVGLCAKDHSLANKAVWQAEDFLDQTLITYPVPDDMLDLLKKVLQPAGINPTRRTSELTIAIIQLVASKRGVAALPFWAAKPYLDRGYIVARKITSQGLYSNLYGAFREADTEVAFVEDFYETVKAQSFSTLPGLSILEE
ncbi:MULTISPECIES: LysR family transcriptional regulator [unclassified Avibacterium]|uniref:LysR family transcriptional regulator n=1 Tax=unclassified Avibacterium TaxID=2685287 RepID=UPI002026879B|nr:MULTISPECIES: LysR family transcriptional regulator [unclassified Avibacterium]MCW9698362.1 LysR family transcriptional regulator [Avibacterium sp. 20-129]MCW9715055.1 LysR family transcriptional regulator [Avibacterium sp. 21-594]MCW9718626.1 LysR family transcriptional regulator [Avibacterium sp. 21-599]MCW9732079.1 LysR family transcriptional regulator [Avibacterium sp. 20-15]URL04258.1 LysR family transcriptional regulator [Avibacterium sp. 20-132]